MNRVELKQLTRDRVRDAKALQAYGQWSGAYHVVGYALECGLKACILKYLDETGIIFTDRNYLGKLAKCWTHALNELMSLANLKEDFDKARGKNPRLEAYWGVAKDWQEISRYQQKTKEESRALFEAITNVPNGVLLWIQSRW